MLLSLPKPKKKTENVSYECSICKKKTQVKQNKI